MVSHASQTSLSASSLILVFNYWEPKIGELPILLSRIYQSGFRSVFSFVPWQLCESDVAHTLTRFLQAASDQNLFVHLLITPELGVHYPSSGLPTSLVSKTENCAMTQFQKKIPSFLPPQIFPIPSYFSPDFLKRYLSFLARMEGFFADFSRNQPQVLTNLQVELSGSFWKYYRPSFQPNARFFQKSAGDYSAQGNFAFRQRLETFYAQEEFAHSPEANQNVWKKRDLEATNRKWFYQEAEEVFRSKNQQILKKKNQVLKVSQLEVFLPEADPELLSSQMLSYLQESPPHFDQISSYLNEISRRQSTFQNQALPSYLHWSVVGSLQHLKEEQRQFLLMQSLVLLGAHGGVLLDHETWMNLSPSFQIAFQNLSQSFKKKQLLPPTQAYYLTPHLWSKAGQLWDELVHKIGFQAKMLTHLPSKAHKAPDVPLLICDPDLLMTQPLIKKLFAWCAAGRVLAFARTSLFSPAAGAELESLLKNFNPISVDLGVDSKVYSHGMGKCVLFEVSSLFSTQGETQSDWQSFLTSLLSLAGVKDCGRMSDERIQLVPFEVQSGQWALFLFNSHSKAIRSNLIFSHEVSLSPLKLLENTIRSEMIHPDVAKFHSQFLSAPSNLSFTQEQARSRKASKFALDLPPYGMLSVRVTSKDLQQFQNFSPKLTSFESNQEGLWN